MKPHYVYAVELKDALGYGVDSVHSRIGSALERAKRARRARFPAIEISRYQIDKSWPSNFTIVYRWERKRGIIWKHPIILARKKAIQGRRKP